MRVIALLAAALPVTGCSFVFVQPPHDDEVRHSAGSCTSSPIAPVLDSVLTLTNLASAVYVATEKNASNRDAAVVLGVSFAALWLSSAIYGFYETSRCSELVSEEAADPFFGPVPSRRPVYRGPGGPEFVAPPPPVPAPVPPPDRHDPAPAP
ncbi:MAG: hypothetical protein ACJ8F1_25695 [Polyangia bacterium]